MKSLSVGEGLYLYINNLAPAIHSVGRIDAMRTESGAVGGVLRQLRCLELIGATALA